MTRFPSRRHARARRCLLVATICTALGPPALAERFEVTASNLSVRSCPSTGCERLRLLPEGTQVSVLEQQGGWARIGPPQDAPCAGGEGRRLPAGTAACEPSTGTEEGLVPEWVAANYLAPVSEPVSEPVAEPVAQPVAEPAAGPTAAASADGGPGEAARNGARPGEEEASPGPRPSQETPEAAPRAQDAAGGPPAGAMPGPAARAGDPDAAEAPDAAPAPPGGTAEAVPAAPVPRLPEGLPGADRWAACLSDYTLLRRHLMAMRDLGLPVGAAEVNAAATRAAALERLAPAMAVAAPGSVPEAMPPRPAQDALSAVVVREGLQAARAALEARSAECDRGFARLW